MCLVTLVCFITYQWIHNRRTSVCTVAISLVTATIASHKTLELPLLIYKLFTIIGQLGLSVKVTLLHQNTQSYNMCSILPLQQMKMYSKSLQFKIRIQLSDLSSSFWSSYWIVQGDPGAGAVHKLPGEGEGDPGPGDGPKKVADNHRKMFHNQFSHVKHQLYHSAHQLVHQGEDDLIGALGKGRPKTANFLVKKWALRLSAKVYRQEMQMFNSPRLSHRLLHITDQSDFEIDHKFVYRLNLIFWIVIV